MHGVSSGRVSSGSKTFGGVKKTTFFGVTNKRQQDNTGQQKIFFSLIEIENHFFLVNFPADSESVITFLQSRQVPEISYSGDKHVYLDSM